MQRAGYRCRTGRDSPATGIVSSYKLARGSGLKRRKQVGLPFDGLAVPRFFRRAGCLVALTALGRLGLLRLALPLLRLLLVLRHLLTLQLLLVRIPVRGSLLPAC